MANLETATASNACSPCRHHKRKCNRAFPACATCIRVGRECVYDFAPVQANTLQGAAYDAGDHSIQYQAAFPVPSNSGIDPFQYPALRQPTIDVFVTQQALTVLGDAAQMDETATRYFATIFLRMPIISRKGFLDQIPNLQSHPCADFAILCLAIHLLIQRPDQVESAGHHAQTMYSSSYVMIKSFIGVLQSLVTPTLHLVQAMALTVFFEMGHGMYPAASISIAACAKAARAIGLNKKTERMQSSSGQADSEQRRRVWWAILVLDRYGPRSCSPHLPTPEFVNRFISLCTEDKMFATDDPLPTDNLPMELDAWENDANVETRHGLTLSTPSDIRVGPFARECQISHLVGRVVRHVFDPAEDPSFQKEEAIQLERTLNAFLPLLIEQEEISGLFCAALGLCSSGLFTLYEAALVSDKYDDNERQAIARSLESTSTRVAIFSNHLFADITLVDINKMSPFVPYSLYQAAVVQHRAFQRTGESDHKQHLNSLKMILANFKKRWLIAGKHLDILERLQEEGPTVMLWMQ